MDREIFPNRKVLWQERQNIKQRTFADLNIEQLHYDFDKLKLDSEKPVYTIPNKNINCGEKVLPSDFVNHAPVETKYDTGYFQECHLQLLEAFQTCPKCKHPDRTVFDYVLDENNYILGKSCTKCNDSFIGMDDSHSIHEIEQLLQKIDASLCDCGNQDINKFILQEDDGKYFFICCKCDKIINSANTEDTSIEDISLDSEITCPCGKKKIKEFDIQLNESESHIISINCNACNSIYNIHDPVDNLDDVPFCSLQDNTSYTLYGRPSVEKIKKSKPVGKKQVNHARDIGKGDHLCFWRTIRWEHHAIVKEVIPSQNKIVVINYYPPKNKGPKGVVTETEICLDKDHPDRDMGGSAEGVIYVIKYNGPCFSPEEIIKRAVERLGETQYNFVSHNCEHFARYCTTGGKGLLKSEQVKSFLKGCVNVCHRITTVITKDLVKSGLLKTALRAGKAGVTYVGADVAVDAAASATGAATGAAEQCAQLCCPAGIGLTIAGVAVVSAFEIYGAYKHIKKTKEKLKEGKCDQETYENEKCGSIAKCVFKIAGISGLGIAGNIAGGAIAGAAGFGAVGNFVCPIVGGLIGATLGALIGLAIGGAIKFGHAKYQQSKAKKHAEDTMTK